MKVAFLPGWMSIVNYAEWIHLSGAGYVYLHAGAAG